jgi:hypothetical protein
MPAAAGGHVIKDALVSFALVEGGGAQTDYTNQLDTATLTPEQSTQTKRTLVPDGTLQDVDSSVWTLTIAGVQDYVAARGLTRWLFDNEGAKANFTVEPIAGGVGFTGVCTLKAVPIGGETGSWAEFSAELPVTGKPAVVDPI